MSENRQKELMSKIMKVKSNDLTALADAEWDIKLTADENDTSRI